jgi:L-fuculose-phosphate aldolase
VSADRADDVKAAVVAAAQRMAAVGLVVGTAGNVSGRQADGTICLTPSSTPYDEIDADGLAVVDLDGNPCGGGRPSTEKAMHLACYRAFPEVGGVVHCHPLHGSMFAVARRPIPAAIEEVIVYVGGDIPVAAYATTGTDDLAEEVVRHLHDRSAVLMANHGLLCVGKSPADALHTAEVVEHTAHIVWGAAALGEPARLPDKVLADFANVYAYLRSQTWRSGGDHGS